MNTKSTASSGIQIDWKRIMFLMIGIILFSVVYLSPPWPDAVDPMGKAFTLSPQGKAAIALFLLAGTWWVLEVVPIGVTGLTIGVVQALFFIRPAADAFKDFMDPSV
ncbi:MAG: SLC13/DASS family transporter, partial [Desulfotignum sp.]